MVSADGKTIAVAINPRPANIQRPSEIRVYKLPSGDLVHSFTQKSVGITHNLALSADGKILFSLRSGQKGRLDSFLQVEKIATGELIAKKEYPSTAYAKMVLSGDGKYLAVTSNNKEVMLWDWHDPGKRPLTLDTQTNVVGSGKLGGTSNTLGGIDFSPDGKWLAMMDAGGKLYVWEIPSGRLHQRYESALQNGTNSFPAFTPDSKTLAWLTRERALKIVLLDVASGQRKQVVERVATPYSHLAFSGDGKTLAINAPQGSSLALQLWDMASNVIKDADVGPQGEPQQIVVSSKGLLASAYSREIRIWDGVTSRMIGTSPLTGSLYALAMAPDARLAAWISSDGFIHVIETQAAQEKYRLNGRGGGSVKNAIAFAADSMNLVSFGSDFHLRRWDMKTGFMTLERAIRPSGFMVPTEEKKLSFLCNQ